MAKDTDQFVNEQKPQRQHQPVKCWLHHFLDNLSNIWLSTL
jgi:hypothetical protein